MKSSFLLMLAGIAGWATSEWLEVSEPLPQAVRLSHHMRDVDGDGVRDRRDPLIDFGKLSSQYTGDFAINVHAFDDQEVEYPLCVDADCQVKRFHTLVTVPDGGRFLLFHLPDNFDGELQPWAEAYFAAP